jgi:hypothetical protein
MSHSRRSALWLVMLPLLAVWVTGCAHKQPVAAPQASTAPPLPPSSMTKVPPVPSMPAPSQPEVGPPGSDQKAQDTQPPPAHHPRRSKKRAAMSEQIREQEVRLSKIKHPLNEEDEAITRQVEVFLAKARQAVTENDLDGAQTLTTKAKVLLDELTRS